MDGDNNYDSDISESWSLIDINSESRISSTLSNLNTEKVDSKELVGVTRDCKEASQPDLSEASNSDSDSDSSKEVVRLSGGNIELGEEAKTDSCDADSIEILDLDGNDEGSDIYRVDDHQLNSIHLDTYQSDDEESLGEFGCKSRTFSAVIKRKRKRPSKISDDTNLSVNSESKSSVKSKLNLCDNDREAKEVERLTRDRHVYKHYRNNVANTFLNLSVGVIFAGVACIAIGHFLGVQEAAETAVELAETLKKLQVENAALQARLFHLNRALLARESNANFKLSLAETKAVPNQTVQGKPEGKPDLNKAALSEIRSSLNSIEWLSRLQNVVQRGTETRQGPELKALETELRSLCNKEAGEVELLRNSDRKVSKILTKVINRLSSSQDNIEKLYGKLLKLNKKVNQEEISEEEKANALIYPQPEKYYASIIKVNSSEAVKFEKKKKGKEEKEKKKEKKKKDKKRFKNGEQTRKSVHEGKKGKSVKKKKMASFNETNDWIFKWAKGRDERRRNEALGDWFFDRAKARRKGKDEDWLFERARFRKELRDDNERESWEVKQSYRNERMWKRNVEKKSKHKVPRE